jgi:hypothetical protein
VVKPIRLLALVAAVVVVALAGCDTPPSVSPTVGAGRPGIRIDPSWQAANGEWTFTGDVQPQGAATDVVLEIGPGPSTARLFDHQVTVVTGVTADGPLTISTREIPDIDEICVRFTATNSAGKSSTPPLCFPHDLPSFVVDADPPTTTFKAPVFGTTTVIHAATFTVSWTESDVGTGVSRRSLQRQVATYAAGACGAFADDAAPSTAVSPLAASDLLDGKCYQWIQSLTDGAGNTSQTTSGEVRVDLGGSG